MKKYWFLFKLSWQERLAYRGDLFLEIIGTFILTLAVMAVWSAASIGKEGIGALGRGQLMAYFFVAGMLMSFYRRAQGDEISDDIEHGNVSSLIVKPISPIGYWAVRDAATRLLELPFVLLAFVPLLLISPWGISVSFARICGFLGLSLLACMLHYLLYTLIALLAFWLEQTWGERFVLNVILEIASGAFVPLVLFPDIWGGVLRMLPFGYLVAVPVEFLLGISPVSWVHALGGMLGWIILCALGMHVAWKKGIRAYEGVGI